MARRRQPECEGNIDPEAVDLDQNPKRRRKPVTRKREPIPEPMKPWVHQAYRRKEKRPVYPGVMIEPSSNGGRGIYTLVSPFQDDDAWTNMIADAFGTRSHSVIGMFFEHLSDLCRDAYDHSNEAWKPNERHLNAAIAIIHASRPKDELDAMLCAQAVAIHWMQMRASANLIGGSSGYLDAQSAAICARLAKTFVTQVEAIDRRKRKPRTSRQVITVKRETHYHRHVHMEGAGSDFCGQAQATKGKIIDGGTIEGTGEPQKRTSLPSPDAGREAVPFSRCEGEASLPHARRGSANRRT